jgi:glycosyltransferase involved in cell wall biosynthesis
MSEQNAPDSVRGISFAGMCNAPSRINQVPNRHPDSTLITAQTDRGLVCPNPERDSDHQNGPGVEVSIIVPAWNEAEWLPRTLDAIEKARVGLGRSSEVIVVDNASSDGTGELARGRGIRVVLEPERQISRVRNTGARAARGHMLVFVDADTWPSAELLRASVSAMASGEVCGGGAQVSFDALDNAIYRAGLRLWNGLARRLNLAAGCFIFSTRAAFHDVGGFSEQVYAGEEVLFSRRMARWGRQNGQRFRVLPAPPVLTSGRKAVWFSPWQHLGLIMTLAVFPFALRFRRMCGFWYRRPVRQRD